jgi:MFS family permease
MNLTKRASLNPILLWFTSAVLGMAGAVLTGFFGLGAAVIALVLAMPLVLRGDRLAALSGLLIGFGGLWSLLLASQIAAGGHLSDPARWTFVGAAPLAIGFVVLMLRLARNLRSTSDIRAR